MTTPKKPELRETVYCRPTVKTCACHGLVTAKRLDPIPGVRAHNESEPHRSWSEQTHLEPVIPEVRRA